MSVKEFVVEEKIEECSGYRRNQTVYDQDDNDKIVYEVNNLTDCPEDAIIERSLVSAAEWLRYVNLGMRLGQDGYTKAVLVYKDDKNDNDIVR